LFVTYALRTFPVNIDDDSNDDFIDFFALFRDCARYCVLL